MKEPKNLTDLYYNCINGKYEDFEGTAKAFDDFETAIRGMDRKVIEGLLVAVYKLASQEEIQGFIRGYSLAYRLIREIEEIQ